MVPWFCRWISVLFCPIPSYTVGRIQGRSNGWRRQLITAPDKSDSLSCAVSHVLLTMITLQDWTRCWIRQQCYFCSLTDCSLLKGLIWNFNDIRFEWHNSAFKFELPIFRSHFIIISSLYTWNDEKIYSWDTIDMRMNRVLCACHWSN